MSMEELVPRVRAALSVDVSYDDEIIPFGIKRQAQRLLRDYHFPWAVQKQVFTPTADQQDYPLPLGFKKELLLTFFDTEEGSYSEPLGKRDGFVLPGRDGIPRHYWVWSGHLSTDISVSAADAATTQLILWYESIDVDDNIEWLIARFEDMLFTLAVFRLAAELNKKELAEIYGALWADDRQALAIYLNELEFDNGVYMQRESVQSRISRYPTSV